MQRRILAGALAAAFLSGAPLSHAQQLAPNPLDVVPDKMPFDVAYGAPISLERAEAAIDATVAEAKKHDWKVNVAVVDSGANLVAFARMDGAQLASIAIAEHKARAAATFRRETKAWEGAIQGGLTIALTGATSSQDEVCAKIGAATINK
jgi:glc operon protein GlcG